MTKSKSSPARAKKDRAQHQHFIKAAREAGVSEDEREFDENLKRIAKVKPAPEKTARNTRS
jgi:hypothetical protein